MESYWYRYSNYVVKFCPGVTSSRTLYFLIKKGKKEMDKEESKAYENNEEVIYNLLSEKELHDMEAAKEVAAKMAAKCTHRRFNGREDSLIYDGNRCRCEICGAEFKPLEIRDMYKACDDMIDCIESFKIHETSSSIVSKYIDIIPLVKDLRESIKDVERKISAKNKRAGDMSAFAMFSNLENCLKNEVSK